MFFSKKRVPHLQLHLIVTFADE